MDVMEELQKNKSMQFLWYADENDNSSSIFTIVNMFKYNDYPFNITYCPEKRIENCPGYMQYLISEIANQYLKHMRNSVSTWYDIPILQHIIMDDFDNPTDNTWKTVQLLLNETNNHYYYKYQIKMKLSSTTEYISRLFDYRWNTTYFDFPQTNKIEFFPYYTVNGEFWTGYYTSKPIFKRVVRFFTFEKQNLKKLVSYFYMSQNNCSQELLVALKNFESEHAIVQHHDAVSGTSKMLVVSDYENNIINKWKNLRELIFLKLFEDSKTYNSTFYYSAYVNCYEEPVNECLQFFKNGEGVLDNGLSTYNFTYFQTFINTHSSRSFIIELKSPVPPLGLKYYLRNKISGSSLNASYFCNDFCCTYYSNIFLNRFERIDIEFLLTSSDLESNITIIDMEDYKSIASNSSKNLKQIQVNITSSVGLTFNPANMNFTLSNCSSNFCQEHVFLLNYGYYKVNDGFKVSGCYIFNPDSINPILLSLPDKASITDENEFLQFEFEYSNYLKSTLLFPKANPFAFNIVTSVLYNNNSAFFIDKEIFVQIKSPNIKNNETYYTDSNGLEVIERNYNKSNNPAKNYFPINSFILIRDMNNKSEGIGIVNERAQGGTSSDEGTLELMISRMPSKDDGKGLGDGCRETWGVNLQYQTAIDFDVKHTVIFFHDKSLNTIQKIILERDHPELRFFGYYYYINDSNFERMPKIETNYTNNKMCEFDAFLKHSVTIINPSTIAIRIHNTNHEKSLTIPFTYKDINIFLSKFAGVFVAEKGNRRMGHSLIYSYKEVKEKNTKWWGNKREYSEIINSKIISIKPNEIITYIVYVNKIVLNEIEKEIKLTTSEYKSITNCFVGIEDFINYDEVNLTYTFIEEPPSLKNVNTSKVDAIDYLWCSNDLTKCISNEEYMKSVEKIVPKEENQTQKNDDIDKNQPDKPDELSHPLTLPNIGNNLTDFLNETSEKTSNELNSTIDESNVIYGLQNLNLCKKKILDIDSYLSVHSNTIQVNLIIIIIIVIFSIFFYIASKI